MIKGEVGETHKDSIRFRREKAIGSERGEMGGGRDEEKMGSTYLHPNAQSDALKCTINPKGITSSQVHNSL